jgi:GT2 family glycosyltransferase
MIEFSIIVCTYKRYDLVMNCLIHLERLEHRHSKNYEIIIVENTPVKDRQVMAWAKDFKNTQIIIEDNTGLSAARNAGIRAAAGKIIIFLDDDAEVYEDWLDQLAIAFGDHPSAQMIGGKVLAKYGPERKPKWISPKCEELLSCINWGDATRLLAPTEWVAGANLAYRSDVFKAFGLFSTNLGRKGEASLLSNEEAEFNARIPSIAKYYCGQAVVNHLIPSARVERQWFRRRVFWQAISDVISEFEGKANRDHLFHTFIQGVLHVPAQHRTVKNLFYSCETSQEFDHQLNQIYRHTIAMSIEGKSWDELL